MVGPNETVLTNPQPGTSEDLHRWVEPGTDGLAAAGGGRYATAVAIARNLLAMAAARAGSSPGQAGGPLRPGDLVLRKGFGDAWMVTGAADAPPGAPRVRLAAATWSASGPAVAFAEEKAADVLWIMPRPGTAPKPATLQPAKAAGTAPRPQLPPRAGQGRRPPGRR